MMPMQSADMPANIIAGRHAIVRDMAACGVPERDMSVTCQPGLEGFEVVIRRPARVPAERFACVEKATADHLLLFEDRALRLAYEADVAHRSRPQRVAAAEAAVAKAGLLAGFPRRAGYPDLSAYVAALEHHAGVGGVVRAAGTDDVVLAPSPGVDVASVERALSVVMYAEAIGDLGSIGLVGNAAHRDK